MRTKEQKQAAMKRQAANQAKKFDAARKQTFGLGKKQHKQKVAQTPVYKSGLLSSGQPRNYATSKKGTITSLD